MRETRRDFVMAMAAAAGFLAAEDAWPFAQYPPTPRPAHPRRLRQGSFVSLCLTRNEQAESKVKTRALETRKDAAPGTTKTFVHRHPHIPSLHTPRGLLK